MKRTWPALMLFVVACAPGSVNDLDRPALAVTIVEEGGFCSSVYAVDGQGAVWRSGGCGDTSGSFEKRTRTVEADDRAALDARMSDVIARGDDAECDLPGSTGRRYRFTRTLAGGGEEEVRQCEPGVALATTQLAEAFEDLGDPPLPDAGPDDAAP